MRDIDASKQGRQVRKHLAYEKQPPVGSYSSPVPWGSMVILGGWVFFMSEVPLYAPPAQHTPVQVVNFLSKETEQLNALS